MGVTVRSRKVEEWKRGHKFTCSANVAVQKVAGKSKGVVAQRNFAVGDEIIREKALLVMQAECRLNHKCKSNARYVWREDLKQELVFTVTYLGTKTAVHVACRTTHRAVTCYSTSSAVACLAQSQLTTRATSA